MYWLPFKTALTIACFVGLLYGMDFLPVLKEYKVMDWASIPKLLDFSEGRSSASPEADVEARLRPDTEPAHQLVHPVVDPKKSLEPFYRALHDAAGRKDVKVRIFHYGDSPTTADLITADARELLQKQFGDAGHGFCLVAKPWAWYQHNGLVIKGDGWTIDPAHQSALRDGMFGIGGVSFRGATGAVSTIRMTKAKHSRIEIAYLKQAYGGVLQVEAAGKVIGKVTTTSAEEGSGFASFPVPPEAGSITLRGMSGQVRIFGVVLERKDPGVVYHSLGINGASSITLSRAFDEKHWRQQLLHYQPDLVIVNYGTNESTYADWVDRASERELREVIRRVRAALPETPVLIMSPMDRGQRMASGGIGTMPTIPRLVAIQERVALETGCAFFNTFAAMGGIGTMGRWYEAEPRLVGADFIHPMPAGARIVGSLLYKGLFDGYNRYKLRILENRGLVASTK